MYFSFLHAPAAIYFGYQVVTSTLAPAAQFLFVTPSPVDQPMVIFHSSCWLVS